MTPAAGASAHTLASGDLQAKFLPAQGMLGASLHYRGDELLRRVDDLAGAAAHGSTAGIPLLHPWANRLAGLRYQAAGRRVELDASSPLLHLDAHGLPMHGIPWSQLAWEVTAARPERISAWLQWSRSDLLAIFPFRHRLEMSATIEAKSLTIATTLVAGSDGAVPVSFGFHPYFGLPGTPRAQWRLRLPAMRQLTLDQRGIPTGHEADFNGFDALLGTADFDDGFALMGDAASFSIAAPGLRISVELLAGYRYAQVFAPRDQDFIALEPMTAPTNALNSGRGLQLVQPGGQFHAAFRIGVETEG